MLKFLRHLFSMFTTERIPIDRIPTDPPVGVNMPVLLQTLFCSSNRVRQTLTGHSPVENAANTFAGTHDGSDATQDAASDTAPSNLQYAVQYGIDTFTASGIISFVRVHTRQKRLTSSNGTYVATIGGVDRGTPVTLVIGPQNNDFDFTTDPATGLVWTAAAINGYNAQGGWGFHFTVVDASLGVTVTEPELWVEVWGTPAPPPVAGPTTTTYDFGVVNAGSAGIAFSSLATPLRDGRWIYEAELPY